MTKLIINRVFAYIFIVLSLMKVIFSMIFVHTSDIGESVFHYVESIVHIILLIFLIKQAIKNHIAHFFHEYFLEAIIMGGISTISLIYSSIIHNYDLDTSLIKLLPVVLSVVVNVFLITSFHHHHDKRVKIILIIFILASIILNITDIVFNINNYIQNVEEFSVFMLGLISNLLSLLFNIFVLLTAISMRHVLRNDHHIVVNYVKLEEDNTEKKIE